ncbi:alpha/beta fold hydrolase [Nonomuraea africana]|uniref:alpha/beta fold hydrolase n=1 Tax=Nonomuraea africana TaxID=46171 RepID=UPI00340DCE01
MTQRGLQASRSAAVVTIALASLVAGLPTATAADSAVAWHACPAYSDEVLEARGLTGQQMSRFRALMKRAECGTAKVPLDYRQPNGRQITVALLRLKAVDRARRLGSIFLNPGGPGVSGYLMPLDLILRGEQGRRLNDRYDLIGFDPRGVGYSTKVSCPAPGQQKPTGAEGKATTRDPGGEKAGPLTREAAKRMYDGEVAANIACGRSDRDFLGRLTTANVARDVDRVRIGLGERTLNFIGVSWGTRLGVVYRSLFPGNVGRMFLDSVMGPRYRQDEYTVASAAAAERNFSRMAAWLAERHDTYGFGSTQKQVRAAILALLRAYDAEPKTFTDLPMPIDGGVVSMLASQNSPDWGRAGKALAQLRDVTGTTAPPAIKEIFNNTGTRMPPGAPEIQNTTMRQGVACNEDPSRLGFSAAWAAYQRNLEEHPVTGRGARFSVQCAGWPLPVQETPLRRTGGSLVLVGHRHEVITPYEWTKQMRTAVGGTLFTVDDDLHGSVTKVPQSDCTAELLRYFTTGRIGRGCDGVPVAS